MDSLTSEFLEFGREKRADLLGIAPIERFDDVAPEHHPRSIFPECRSVVVVGKRITRGTLRGLEEGTQLNGYDLYGRHWLIDRMLAMTTILLATWLEDHRWEACPVQDLPPQVPPSGIAVRTGLPAPNVMIDVAQAAVRAGLGEIGLCGEILTPQYGPRQRFQIILTDAPLDPTPILDDPVCDQCGLCAEACPLGAIGAAAATTVAGKEMSVAAIDYAQCRLCRNGALPNRSHESGHPDRLGALCVRTCLAHLEDADRIRNTFTSPFRKRPAWQIDANGHASLQDA
jgi:epoxyqueuosine reductase